MNDHQSLGESLHRLGEDLGDLVRAELALFKKEAAEQLSQVAAAGVWIGGAAVFGLAALGAFTALLMIALGLVLPLWLSALIVTALWGFLAIGLATAAIAQLRAALPLKFDKTTRNVKEDIEWIKSGAKSAK